MATVTGVLTRNGSGLPVAGVVVQAKDASGAVLGTATTDILGQYTLTFPTSASTVVVSPQVVTTPVDQTYSISPNAPSVIRASDPVTGQSYTVTTLPNTYIANALAVSARTSTLYAVERDGTIAFPWRPYRLHRYNLITGAQSSVPFSNPTVAIVLLGASVDPTTDILYVMDRSKRLFSVSGKDGASPTLTLIGTMVPSPGTSTSGDISFDAAGNLSWIQDDGRVYAIDKTSAAVTGSVLTSPNIPFAFGLSRDGAAGKTYLGESVSSGVSRFIEVNPTTGAATILATVPFDVFDIAATGTALTHELVPTTATLVLPPNSAGGTQNWQMVPGFQQCWC
jgi:hypothetical protein